MRTVIITTVLTIASISTFCVATIQAEEAVPKIEVMSPEKVAAEIDRIIGAKLKEAGSTSAPIADDAEFMRRVSLDLCGKIPSAALVRDFLDDDADDKRQQLVEKLLRSPSYIIHYTNLWRASMVPEADNDQNLRIALPGFESWLRSRIAENRNFAEIVDEMLTLEIGMNDVNGFQQPGIPSPAAFYVAKQAEPERLAAATARLFLGMRIDCAQCHDHPFDDWKQEQFWEHAAFFTDLPQQNQNSVNAVIAPFKIGMIAIPDKNKTVKATFLDGTSPDFSTNKKTRSTLAQWITADDNPYFAKAAANRIWSYHFGVGLVEPMDDFSPHNPASHPELLELLAEQFRSHEYDFKFLIRAITLSKAYQRTSRQTDPSQDDPRLFARAAVRGMTPEQIFDSLAQATGYRQPFDPEQPLNFNNDQARQEFIATFANQAESATDRSSTILQALSLMNGDFISDATDLTDSRTLAAVIDAPFLDKKEKINALFLATLSRFPTEKERSTFLDYINSGGANDDKQAAVSDVFWALLNTSEFLLNH